MAISNCFFSNTLKNYSLNHATTHSRDCYPSFKPLIKNKLRF